MLKQDPIQHTWTGSTHGVYRTAHIGDRGVSGPRLNHDVAIWISSLVSGLAVTGAEDLAGVRLLHCPLNEMRLTGRSRSRPITVVAGSGVSNLEAGLSIL